MGETEAIDAGRRTLYGRHQQDIRACLRKSL